MYSCYSLLFPCCSIRCGLPGNCSRMSLALSKVSYCVSDVWIIIYHLQLMTAHVISLLIISTGSATPSSKCNHHNLLAGFYECDGVNASFLLIARRICQPNRHLLRQKKRNNKALLMSHCNRKRVRCHYFLGDGSTVIILRQMTSSG